MSFFEAVGRMQIVEKPSDKSNYNERMFNGQHVKSLDEAQKVVDTFVIHDPGIEDHLNISDERKLEITLDEMTLPNKKKSAHYTMATNGQIYKHVDLMYNAWHCGESELFGRKWLNSYSVGIEVVKPQGQFNDIQYYALAKLINDTRQVFPLITPNRIVGHYHISPQRKSDPKGFDFEKLFQIMYADRKWEIV